MDGCRRLPTGLLIDLEFINFIFIERKAEGLNPLPKTFWRKPGSELQSVSSRVLILQASRVINPFCCKHFGRLVFRTPNCTLLFDRATSGASR